MPVVVPDLRLVSGAVTAAALLADPDGVIADWTANNPDGWVIGWELVSDHFETREGLNGVTTGFGLLHWKWTIGEMTSEMVDVLRGFVFPNGIITNPQVTAYTPAKGWAGGSTMLAINASVTWPGLNRILLNPKPGDTFSNVVLEFFNGTVAASGA